LAEAMGLRVIFYDTVGKLALGNAKSKDSLEELLKEADFVTLHVPLAPDTKNMIGAPQLALMKPGSYLLNASRGNVVVIEDVVAALQSKHLAGAYFDVFPSEPKVSTGEFATTLAKIPNVTLTPHIGGATHEAQEAIGVEVTQKLLEFVNTGSTYMAVNFPSLRLTSLEPGFHRIINIHRNVSGVMKDLNNILSEFNISAQMLGTQKDIGYMICDVDREAGKGFLIVFVFLCWCLIRVFVGREIHERILALPTNIRTRILY
jgi:D-3-phosphoglycerate dehydrogenase